MVKKHRHALWTALIVTLVGFGLGQSPAGARGPDGDGSVEISGDLMQWHKVTLTLDGPWASERDEAINPFLDYRMTVVFTHKSGSPKYHVPGYFAADGDAANTSADSGTKWRAHLSPDKPGTWSYEVLFTKGKKAAAADLFSRPASLPEFAGKRGQFEIAPTDKTGRDFRGKGRLQYAGEHYLQFAGSGEYFLKAGPDAPETLLAYVDFDGTQAMKKNVPLKTWQPHVQDWQTGDPTWQDGKGKGLIGALNYLAAKGCNAFSLLPYNASGDGDNVWPFVERDDKLHYDCSKLDQWQIVFGYKLPQNDLLCEDFRSRDRSWDYCRIAVEFFHDNEIPFRQMTNADALVGNSSSNNSKYCFAKGGEIYLVYLPSGGSTTLDLTQADGDFTVQWFNPRSGGELSDGSVKLVVGGDTVSLGNPPEDTGEDWVIVVRK